MSESYPRPSPEPKRPMLSDKAYKYVKWLSAFVLPALSALYLTLGQLWGFPNLEEVVGTVTALNTFLGGLLAYSTKSYNNSEEKYDGEFQFGGANDARLLMNVDPMDVDKNNLNIRIVKRDEAS